MIDTNLILRRINEEIARRDRGELTPSETTGPNLSHLVVTPEPLKPGLDYATTDFMKYHDTDFVNNAFTCLLGRHGGSSYLDGLRTGRLSKIDILGRIRYSAEGRRIGARVSGLLPRFLLHSAFKIPLFGYLLQLMYHTLRIPVLVKRQQILEEQFAVADRDLAVQMNQRLDEIAKSTGFSSNNDQS